MISTRTPVAPNFTGPVCPEKSPAREIASPDLLIVALITTGLALLPLVFCMRLEAIFCGLVGLVLAHYLMRRWYEPRLGGYTGDCLGAVQQCSEVGFYLGLLVVIGA